MWKMVQKNSFKNIFLSWFKNLFTSTLDTTIIGKMSNTHWHPGKRCCIPLHEKNLSKFWLKILFVTSHNTSGLNVKMRLLCHKSHPWLNQSKWYSIRKWSSWNLSNMSILFNLLCIWILNTKIYKFCLHQECPQHKCKHSNAFQDIPVSWNTFRLQDLGSRLSDISSTHIF